jgi:hypothetical protein
MNAEIRTIQLESEKKHISNDMDNINHKIIMMGMNLSACRGFPVNKTLDEFTVEISEAKNYLVNHWNSFDEDEAFGLIGEIKEQISLAEEIWPEYNKLRGLSG